jgi:hypothetical protein
MQKIRQLVHPPRASYLIRKLLILTTTSNALGIIATQLILPRLAAAAPLWAQWTASAAAPNDQLPCDAAVQAREPALASPEALASPPGSLIQTWLAIAAPVFASFMLGYEAVFINKNIIIGLTSITLAYGAAYYAAAAAATASPACQAGTQA